jgi:hypothetical protein
MVQGTRRRRDRPDKLKHLRWPTREGVCLLAAALHDACYFVVIEPFQGGGRAQTGATEAVG